MTSQEKWSTSGASRLKAIQNRGFSYRAKQRATAGTVGSVMDNKRSDHGRRQPAKRRRIIVGRTASSEATVDPYASSALLLAEMAGAQHAERQAQHHAIDQQHPGEVQRGNRRIREVSATIHPREYYTEQLAAAGLMGPSFATLHPCMDPLTRAMILGRPVDASAAPRHQMMSHAVGRSSLVDSHNFSAGLNYLKGESLQQLADQQQALSSGAGMSNLRLPSQGIARFRPALFATSPSLSTNNLSPAILSNDPLSSGLSLNDLRVGNMISQPPPPPRHLIQELLASRQHLSAPTETAATDGPRQALFALQHGIETTQARQNQQERSSETPQGSFDEHGPRGIAKFQKRGPQQSLSSTLTSQDQDKDDVGSISTKASQEKVQTQKPIRFFNEGSEVSMAGRPVTKPTSSIPTIAEKQGKQKQTGMKRKNKRKVENVVEAEKERKVQVSNLQERQQSIWDAFALENEEDKQKGKTKKSQRIDDRNATFDPSQLDLEITESSKRILSDPSKIASASVDDIVRDSLTERQNTLSAASVLMALSPRCNSYNS